MGHLSAGRLQKDIEESFLCLLALPAHPFLTVFRIPASTEDQLRHQPRGTERGCALVYTHRNLKLENHPDYRVC